MPDSNRRFNFEAGWVAHIRPTTAPLPNPPRLIYRRHAGAAMTGGSQFGMSATLLLFGVLLALVILIRSVRWLAVIALLVAIAYVAHNRLDYRPHDERQDRMNMPRPR
jgi:hypothetical protein